VMVCGVIRIHFRMNLNAYIFVLPRHCLASHERVIIHTPQRGNIKGPYPGTHFLRESFKVDADGSDWQRSFGYLRSESKVGKHDDEQIEGSMV
jgi:hypothetical protein